MNRQILPIEFEEERLGFAFDASYPDGRGRSISLGTVEILSTERQVYDITPFILQEFFLTIRKDHSHGRQDQWT